jgi:hypothetical protein
MVFGSLLLIVFGILHIVFAFREPPKAIAHWFRVPIVFVFFAPERRAKLGRITVGAFLVALGFGFEIGDLYHLIFGWHGPQQNGPLDARRLGSILLGLVVVGVFGAARRKRAGEVSDAEDAERRVQRQSFEMLKSDPRFLHVQHYLGARGYRTTFEGTPDPSTYRIVYVELLGAKYQPLLAPDGAGARWLVAYLERGAAPKRLKVTLDVQTSTCTELEAGWLFWGGPLPPNLRGA